MGLPKMYQTKLHTKWKLSQSDSRSLSLLSFGGPSHLSLSVRSVVVRPSPRRFADPRPSGSLCSIMSDISRGLAAPDKPNIIGPDFFSYYAQEVADLLQGEELLCFVPTPADSESALRGDCSSAKPLFRNIMADSTSDTKKELLKTLLKECLSTLTQEVVEISDPVINLRRELSQLKCKKKQLAMEFECQDKLEERPYKKMKAGLSSSEHGMSVGDGAFKSDPGTQVDEDGHRVLLHEQIMRKDAKEYAVMLHHMEKKLEAILENTTTQCRTMTRLEKLELKTSIQKLPSRNLERVAEIIFCKKPSGSPSSDEVLVDLENEDNTILWRLYFYVKAVDSARKLSQ